MNVSVIIPALNEEKAIGKVIRDVPKDFVNQIIVVDNGSSDNTSTVAQEAGARVIREKRKGYGAACLSGLKALDNCDIVVFLDGDYSDHPEEMPRLVSPIINEKADLVIGSRLLGSRSKGALPPHSIFGNWLAAKLLRLFYGLKLSDLGPFRAVKADVLKTLRLKNQTYGFPIETITKAAAKKFRILEVPVSYRKRIGKSKISGTIKGSFLAAYHIVFTIFRHALVKNGF